MGYAYDREQDRFQVGCMQADLKKILCADIPFEPQFFHEFGFCVFSQWDEDGLIQYLINHVEIPDNSKKFVEFGVENYSESNTKFLLMHDNWTGLIMDASPDNMKYARSCNFYWRHSLHAVDAFITRENINDLIADGGMTGDIGILSIDIDGNDYHVWKEINVISPRIVICEVNPFFGAKEAVSIPYEENFFRTKAHYSNLYYGASLAAMVRLGKEKGYSLVCINSAGQNAFFVRNDCMKNLKEVAPEDVWKSPKYRESRDEEGNLTYLDYVQGLELIKDMDMLLVDTLEKKKIKDLRFYNDIREERGIKWTLMKSSNQS